MRDNNTYIDPTQANQNEILLGRYRVLEERATGGFGAVKICWDRRLTRRVAIKCMPLFDQTYGPVAASTINEALAEARSCCMVSHPNIVTVHDFEVENGYAYLVMEYIDGLNLEELMNRVEGGVLTYEETAHVLDCIASALTYAHENQVLHLDIKPANIMINSNGNVKLTDFGMASLASATGYADSRGGTVGYMPPEQIEGMLVDERCDVFALACVAWKCLCGKNPFAAKSAEASLKKILKGPKPPLSKAEPPLAGPVEETLKHAMAAEPSMRLMSCDDLADILVPALGNADRGQSSLRDLIQQSLCDEPEIPEYLLDKQAPLEEYEWAPVVVEKGMAAISCGLLTWMVSDAFALSEPIYNIILSLLCATAAAASQSLGGGISIAVICLSLIFRSANFDSTQMLYAIGTSTLMFLGLGYWWIKIGRENQESNTALIMPFATRVPFASIPYAIEVLPTPIAAITCTISFILVSLFTGVITPVNTNISDWSTFVDSIGDLSMWIGAIGAGLSAGIGSYIRNKHSKSSPLIAQACACFILLLIQFIGYWVENDGIWQIVDTQSILIAVTLFACMGIVTILLGPNRLGQEAK